MSREIIIDSRANNAELTCHCGRLLSFPGPVFDRSLKCVPAIAKDSRVRLAQLACTILNALLDRSSDPSTVDMINSQSRVLERGETSNVR